MTTFVETTAPMPVISMFYGLIIAMYYLDNKQHHLPHIHVKYGEEEAVFAIETCEMIDGSLPTNKRKLIEAWMEIHREDLAADWQLAVQGQKPFPIEPLR